MVKRFALWVTVVLLMTVIFKFSSEPASVSNVTSRDFTYKVLSVSERFRALPESEKKEIVEDCQTVARKGAHFVIYTLLGFFLCLSLTASGLRKFVFAAPIIAAVYAASDEVHQIFIAGRTSQIQDVFLDFAGALFGTLIAFAVVNFAEKRRSRHG